MNRETPIADSTKPDHGRAMVLDAIQTLDVALALWDEDIGFVFANDLWFEKFHPQRDVQPGDDGIDLLRRQLDQGLYVVPEGLSADDFVDQIMGLLTSYAKDVPIEFTDGTVFSASVHETGLTGFLISFRDITDQTRSQREADVLRAKTERANARLRDALESIGEGFALFDNEDRLILANDLYKSANPAAAHLMTLGRPRKEIIEAMTHGGDILGVADWIDSYDRETAVGDTSSPRRYEVHHADGRVFMASRGRTAEGGCTITWLDITDSKKTEARARAIANDAMESLDEGFGLYDADLRFVFCNRMYGDIALNGRENIPEPGTSLEEHLSHAYDLKMSVAANEMTREAYIDRLRTFATSYQKHAEFERVDGSILQMSSHQTELGGYLITARDITDERRAEERALAKLTDTVQALDTGLILLDRDLKFVFGNERLMKIFHRQIPAPNVGEPMEQIARRLAEGGVFKLPDGVSPERSVRRTMRLVKDMERNAHVVTRDGRVYRCSVYPTKDDGRVIDFMDVTEQRMAEAELQRQQEAAHQNEKLSAMGELLAGVAHELNNPLSIVVGYAMMMQNSVTDPKLRRQIDNVAQAAERCSRIVKAFLAMARQRPADLKRCSLNELMMAAVDMIGHRLRGAGIEVSLDLDPNLQDVEADEDQIIQVFTNLLVNAEQALSDQDGPRRLHLRSFLDRRAGKAVARIADNGPGIAPVDIKRIFEPFYTTKDVGTGTGIGLAFCHRVVTSHGGRMTVRSAPGAGARFYVRLALCDPDDVTQEAPVAVQEDPRAGSVLVVDDEAGVAQLIGDVLGDAGYRVQIMNAARDALKAVRTRHFDAVISDIRMPGMDGPAFSEALRAINPGLADRVGFVTGDTLSTEVAAFLAETKQPHLEKPVTPTELLLLVQGLMEKRSV